MGISGDVAKGAEINSIRSISKIRTNGTPSLLNTNGQDTFNLSKEIEKKTKAFKQNYVPTEFEEKNQELFYDVRNKSMQKCQLDSCSGEIAEFYPALLKEVEFKENTKLPFKFSNGKTYSPKKIIPIVKGLMAHNPLQLKDDEDKAIFEAITEHETNSLQRKFQQLSELHTALFQQDPGKIATLQDAQPILDKLQQKIEEPTSILPDVEMQAVKAVRKALKRKLTYKQLMEKPIETLTDREQRIIEDFEQRSHALEQSFYPGLVFSEPLQPGYKMFPGLSSTFRWGDTVIIDPGRDPHLRKNIESLKKKLTDAGFDLSKLAAKPPAYPHQIWDSMAETFQQKFGFNPSQITAKPPVYTDKELHQVWDVIMEHLDDTFPVPSRVANRILDGLETQHLIGKNIELGVGVCRHKAALTKLYAQELGLDAALVSGTLEGGGHAWNMIKINGKLHYFDAHNHLKQPPNPELEAMFVPYSNKFLMPN
jgi:hypothetical protein